MKPALSLLAALLACTAASLALGGPVNTMRGSEVPAPDQPPAQLGYIGGKPGNQKLLPRAFKGQPPLVPHAIADYELTPADNACIECHISDELRGKKMPKMGKAHFVAGKVDADGNAVVDMTRWQCDTCHVAQVDAKPLVDNRFRSVGIPAR